MRNHNPARQQVQLVLDTAGQGPILDIKIERIPDNRVPHVLGMGPQLMRPPRHRLHRQPGQFLRRRLDNSVIRHRMARTLVTMPRDLHPWIPFVVLALCEIGRDSALLDARNTRHKRPIDFPRVARPETFRQRRRRKPRLRHHETARRILVQPVHEPRFLPLRVAHGFQQPVDMADCAGASLHRQAHRLVQHHHVVILEQDQRPDKRRVRSLCR